MKVQTEKGVITVSSDVFTNITGAAATNCYGVKGMAIRLAKGVKVTYHGDGTISLELHIIVDNGVNLMAISRAIMERVKYDVSRTTGVAVKSVDVFIDSMVIG